MTFRIAQISDTHLSAVKPFFVENFRSLGPWLRAARPDLVLNSGDISLDGAGREEDLSAAKALHDEIGLTVRYIPGNHDVGDNLDVPDRHGQPALSEDRLAAYRRHYGEDWWLLDVPGWRIIALNTQLAGSAFPDAAAQEEFLAGAVAGAAGRAIALFVHKPLFDRQADEAEIGGRFPNPAPRQSLLRHLAARPPSLVASGHVHQYRSSAQGLARAIWAPSTAFVVPASFQPIYGLKQVGYVEHRLHPDGTHDSGFVQPGGMKTLDIIDFKDAYGELPPPAEPTAGML